MTSMTIVCNWR